MEHVVASDHALQIVRVSIFHVDWKDPVDQQEIAALDHHQIYGSRHEEPIGRSNIYRNLFFFKYYLLFLNWMFFPYQPFRKIGSYNSRSGRSFLVRRGMHFRDQLFGEK